MGNSKNGLRALGLSFLAVLGLMAFFASAAQAGNGSFTVNTVPAVKGEKITGEQVGLGTLLVAARNLQITCHSGAITETEFLNSKEALGKVKFEGCLAEKLGGGEIANCIITNGKTITTTAYALAVLHNGSLYVLFEPDTAEPLNSEALFTSVVFESGKGCALPLNNPVKGQVTALVTTGLEAATHTLEFSEANQLDVLKYGTATSFIDAKATATVPGSTKVGIH